MVKVLLAGDIYQAMLWCRDHDYQFSRLIEYNIVLADSVKTLEGLRFRYEDVIRLPGWSKRSDIEEIEDRILRTHVAMGYPDDVCTFGTALH